MSEHQALVVGIEQHQDPAVPAAPCADADATRVARALEAIGFTTTLLTGPQATRTAIDSRLRKLAASPAKLLLVYWSGRALAEGSDTLLACHDTLADDRAETALPLRQLLQRLEAAHPDRLVLALDCRGTTWPREALHAFLKKHSSAVGLISSSPGQDSHVSGSLKSSLWSHLLTELLAGRPAAALEADRYLTVPALQAHLEAELPRLLRTTFREAPPQDPVCLGSRDRLVLADLAGLVPADQPTADPRLQPLRRGLLRNETTSKIKSLAGYRKFHRLPDRVNASSRKFVSDLAADDIRQDVDSTYAAVRESLGYKRRDVEGSADRGTGFVRTPDFEYSISVDLAEDDPTTVVWRREVAGIQKPEVVLGPEFQQVFGQTFDTLVFEFARPFDLEAWVDRVEDDLPEGVKLRTSSDCSSCDVQVRGKGCLVRLFRDRIEILGQKGPGSKGLVEGFLSFQEVFGQREGVEMLPLPG